MRAYIKIIMCLHTYLRNQKWRAGNNGRGGGGDISTILAPINKFMSDYPKPPPPNGPHPSVKFSPIQDAFEASPVGIFKSSAWLRAKN